MGRNILYSFLAVVCAMWAIASPCVFSQEAAVASKEIAGAITAVDLENSTVVIKYLEDAVNSIYKEITISVDAATVIEKNNAAISLVELKTDDEVKVVYSTAADGNNIAKIIRVNIVNTAE